MPGTMAAAAASAAAKMPASSHLRPRLRLRGWTVLSVMRVLLLGVRRAGWGGRIAGGTGRQVRRLHCWLEPPQQLYSWIFVPLAVLALAASRHSPDWTPLMVPLEL